MNKKLLTAVASMKAKVKATWDFPALVSECESDQSPLGRGKGRQALG